MHFVAEELRRRGVPTRHLHVWDDYDRFRKVPVGVDPSWSEHIGRPLSKVPDPEGCHDSWAEHFKQPLHDALHAMGVDMDEVSQTERYEAGHYRDAVLTAVAARDAIEAVLARHRTKSAAPSRRTSRRPPRWPTRSPPTTTTSRSAPATWPGSPTSPTAATAAATPSRSRRTTTRRPSSPTPATSTATPARTILSLGVRGQAGLEGRLADALGLRARRLRAGRHGPRDARVVVHRRPRAGGEHLRHAPAGVVRLWVRRLRRRPEDVVVGRRRPDRRGRAADPRGADPALALRAPQPAPDLQHRLRARGGPALRRVGRAGPQGRSTRLVATRRCSPSSGPSRTGSAGPLPTPAGRRAVPAAVVGRRRDRRQRGADQPDRVDVGHPHASVADLEPRLCGR